MAARSRSYGASWLAVTAETGGFIRVEIEAPGEADWVPHNFGATGLDTPIGATADRGSRTPRLAHAEVAATRRMLG